MSGEGAGQPRWCYGCHRGSGELFGWMVWTHCTRWPRWAPCLAPALETKAKTPVEAIPLRCLPGSSQVLARVWGHKCPPPLRELPGITRRGRVCNEVMNWVVGTGENRAWGRVQRLKPYVEVGQSLIIPLPFTAPAFVKVPYLEAL